MLNRVQSNKRLPPGLKCCPFFTSPKLRQEFSYIQPQCLYAASLMLVSCVSPTVWVPILPLWSRLLLLTIPLILEVALFPLVDFCAKIDRSDERCDDIDNCDGRRLFSSECRLRTPHCHTGVVSRSLQAILQSCFIRAQIGALIIAFRKFNSWVAIQYGRKEIGMGG